jgi:uncharacterized protein YrrD
MEREMFKGKNFIGKEVLSRAEGEKIGSIKDLIIAKDHSRITALLVDEGGLFGIGTPRVIPVESVVSFGSDVVVVTDREAVVPADRHPESKESLDSSDNLIDKKVYTERGDEQARVADIYFKDNSGQITGLELTGGVLANASGGRAYLPVEDIISIGHDAVIIKTEAASNLVAQASGAAGTPARVEPD